LPAEELATTPVAQVFANWLAKAEERITTGIDYCYSLTNWRIRFATALPALIGARTIALLRAADHGTGKIKVPRKEVRRILVSGGLASTSPRALKALFQRLIAP
jgi:farnesyl-diphosphate farnesyltransferase